MTCHPVAPDRLIPRRIPKDIRGWPQSFPVRPPEQVPDPCRGSSLVGAVFAVFPSRHPVCGAAWWTGNTRRV
jgi:hypothetical protein